MDWRSRATKAAPLAILLAATVLVTCTGTEAYSTGIVNGTFTVPAGTYSTYMAVVTSDMSNARLQGSFTTSGDSNNDIVVLVLDRANFDNWRNGRACTIIYTSGQITTGSLTSYIPVPDTYYLVYAAYSLVSPTDVTTRVDLYFSM